MFQASLLILLTILAAPIQAAEDFMDLALPKAEKAVKGKEKEKGTSQIEEITALAPVEKAIQKYRAKNKTLLDQDPQAFERGVAKIRRQFAYADLALEVSAYENTFLDARVAKSIIGFFKNSDQEAAQLENEFRASVQFHTNKFVERIAKLKTDVPTLIEEATVPNTGLLNAKKWRQNLAALERDTKTPRFALGSISRSLRLLFSKSDGVQTFEPKGKGDRHHEYDTIIRSFNEDFQNLREQLTVGIKTLEQRAKSQAPAPTPKPLSIKEIKEAERLAEQRLQEERRLEQARINGLRQSFEEKLESFTIENFPWKRIKGQKISEEEKNRWSSHIKDALAEKFRNSPQLFSENHWLIELNHIADDINATLKRRRKWAARRKALVEAPGRVYRSAKWMAFTAIPGTARSVATGTIEGITYGVSYMADGITTRAQKVPELAKNAGLVFVGGVVGVPLLVISGIYYGGDLAFQGLIAGARRGRDVIVGDMQRGKDGVFWLGEAVGEAIPAGAAGFVRLRENIGGSLANVGGNLYVIFWQIPEKGKAKANYIAVKVTDALHYPGNLRAYHKKFDEQLKNFTNRQDLDAEERELASKFLKTERQLFARDLERQLTPEVWESFCAEIEQRAKTTVSNERERKKALDAAAILYSEARKAYIDSAENHELAAFVVNHQDLAFKENPVGRWDEFYHHSYTAAIQSLRDRADEEEKATKKALDMLLPEEFTRIKNSYRDLFTQLSYWVKDEGETITASLAVAYAFLEALQLRAALSAQSMLHPVDSDDQLADTNIRCNELTKLMQKLGTKWTWRLALAMGSSKKDEGDWIKNSLKTCDIQIGLTQKSRQQKKADEAELQRKRAYYIVLEYIANAEAAQPIVEAKPDNEETNVSDGIIVKPVVTKNMEVEALFAETYVPLPARLDPQPVLIHECAFGCGDVLEAKCGRLSSLQKDIQLSQDRTLFIPVGDQNDFLPCGHFTHRGCMEDGFKAGKGRLRCPICRADVPTLWIDKRFREKMYLGR